MTRVYQLQSNPEIKAFTRKNRSIRQPQAPPIGRKQLTRCIGRSSIRGDDAWPLSLSVRKYPPSLVNSTKHGAFVARRATCRYPKIDLKGSSFYRTQALSSK
jgi:hypothetical protein